MIYSYTATARTTTDDTLSGCLENLILSHVSLHSDLSHGRTLESKKHHSISRNVENSLTKPTIGAHIHVDTGDLQQRVTPKIRRVRLDPVSNKTSLKKKKKAADFWNEIIK